MLYIASYIWLKMNRDIQPIIISDLSVRRNAILAAACDLNREILWWQDDFHHKPLIKYNFTSAVLINENANSEFNINKIGINKYKRKIEENIKIISKKTEAAGIILNNRVVIDDAWFEKINLIASKMDKEVIYIRPHPNSKIEDIEFKNKKIKISNKAEELKTFANKIDVAICSNTATQIWLLKYGVPVIHLDGIDSLVFDTYKYVENKMVYGVKNIEDINEEKMNEFYMESKWINKFKEYTNVVSDDVSDLQKIIEK